MTLTGVNVLDQASGDGWQFYNADNIEVIRALPSDSIGLTVTSIPFASLYTYSPSERDIGNCRNDNEFERHMQFLARELLRVTQPGRCVSVHTMDLPTFKQADGEIGLRDFRGLTIRIFREAGFIWHSGTTIWKDPVTAMQRTHALGLLHKQVRADSCRSRTGIPDFMLQFFKPLSETPEDQRIEALEYVLREMLPSYLLTFRRDGVNASPVTHTPEDYPVDLWQRVASPVWATAERTPDREGMTVYGGKHAASGEHGGVNPTDTLQFRSAREHEDEKHICPLQLEVIRRIVKLYSNPGDVVADFFGGIGSTGVVAVEMDRKAILVELKRSYYAQGVKNVRAAEPSRTRRQMTLEGM